MRKHYTMKKNITYRLHVLSILYVLFLLFAASCAKNQIDRSVIETRKIQKMISEGFILPVDLSSYGFLNGPFIPLTKAGAASTSYMPPVDSLIDRMKAKQISYPDGIVYTQVPFKMNGLNVKGAFSGSRKTISNSIVPIKCFYIRMENCFKQSEEEYIVTMIPSAFQVTSDPDYDFLDKPNFDGIILYSQTDGTYLRTRIYSRGIIEEGRMLQEECEIADKTYIGFYNATNIRTKTEPIQEDTLITLYVTAGRPPRPYVMPDFPQYDIFLPPISEKEKPPLGGEPIEPGNKPLADLECTLIVRQGGCSQQNNFWKCEKGSDIIIQASSPSPDCIFLCWVENDLLLSNRPSVSIKMDKDRSILARYVSQADGGCYRLAKFATDTMLMKQIENIRRQTSNTKKEHSTSKRADGTYYKNKGEEGSIKANFEQGIKYKNRFHTHPVSNIFTSAADLLSLRVMVKDGLIFNKEDFIYGTVTDSKILCLQIKDLTKFMGYFDRITKKEEFIKAYFTNIYEEKFTNPLKTINAEKADTLYTRILSEMGISIFMGNSFEEDGIVKHNWKNYDMENNIIDFKQCY